MLVSVFIVNFAVCVFQLELTLAQPELTNETYGKTWMYFPNGDEVPEVIYLTENPQPRISFPDNKDIEIELYTREHPRTPRRVRYRRRSKRDVLSSISQYFNPNDETKVIVHGWKSSTQSDTVQAIKDEYLKSRSCNVFAINWSDRASDNYYFGPAGDTKNVGRQIASLLDYLIEEKDADPKRMHIIGHSLGAHTAGFGGSYMKKGRVSRITGLDPALPGFEFVAGPEGRLDPTDAEFVDVIHSCAGALGYSGTLGHVDFYPNGGSCPQPGCAGIMQIFQACSHGRSHRFFAESINTENGFYAQSCESWTLFTERKCSETDVILMGDRVEPSARGVYYLRTNSETPFALGSTL